MFFSGMACIDVQNANERLNPQSWKNELTEDV